MEEDLERWTRLYYVGAQAFESGIMQGELAAEAFLTDQSLDKNGDGIFQYVVLEGEAGHQDAIVRTEYSVSTMIDSGVEVESWDMRSQTGTVHRRRRKWHSLCHSLVTALSWSLPIMMIWR